MTLVYGPKLRSWKTGQFGSPFNLLSETVNVQHPLIKIHVILKPLHEVVAPMAFDFLDLARQVFPEHKPKLRAHLYGRTFGICHKDQDCEALRAHRKTKDVQDRFCQLVLNYTREDVIDKLGIQDDFGEMYGYSSSSEPEDLDRLKSCF